MNMREKGGSVHLVNTANAISVGRDEMRACQVSATLIFLAVILNGQGPDAIGSDIGQLSGKIARVTKRFSFAQSNREISFSNRLFCQPSPIEPRRPR